MRSKLLEKITRREWVRRQQQAVDEYEAVELPALAADVAASSNLGIPARRLCRAQLGAACSPRRTAPAVLDVPAVHRGGRHQAARGPARTHHQRPLQRRCPGSRSLRGALATLAGRAPGGDRHRPAARQLRGAGSTRSDHRIAPRVHQRDRPRRSARLPVTGRLKVPPREAAPPSPEQYGPDEAASRVSR